MEIGDRVTVVSRKHPWYNNSGTITKGPHHMRFAGELDRAHIYVVVTLDNGIDSGCRTTEIQKTKG